MVTPFDADLRVDEAATVAPRPPPGGARLRRAGDRRAPPARPRPSPTRRRSRSTGSRCARWATARASSPGTGSNDTAHSVHLTRAGRRGRASTPSSSSRRTTTAPRGPGIIAPRRGDRRGRPAGDPLQHPGPLGRQHGARPDRRAGGRSPTWSPSSRPTRTWTSAARSRAPPASRSTPATTTCCFPVLEMGGTGVISVASHLVGDEMAAIVAAARRGDLDEARRRDAAPGRPLRRPCSSRRAPSSSRRRSR